MKKLIALLIVFSMILSVAPTFVFAQDAEPDLSGATLIEEIVFDENFANSYMCEKVIYDNFSDAEGFDVIYSQNGVALTRIAEGTDASTGYKNFAIRFTDYVLDEENNTELYQQGFAGTYIFDFTISTDITPVTGKNGTVDLYFSDYKDGASITANRYQIKPSDGSFQSNKKTIKFSNVNDNKDHKIRFAVDTTVDKIYGYEFDESAGGYVYKGTDAYTVKADDSIRSLQFLVREYVEKDSVIKIKKLDISEVKRQATTVDSLPAYLVKNSKEVTENITITEDLSAYTITSSDESVLKPDGVITRGAEDKDVSLSVSGNKDGIAFEKIYHFTVKASDGSGGEGGSGSEGEGGETPENPDDEEETDSLTGGKLIANMNLNKEFAESSFGKIAVYDNFNAASDGFESVYEEDGITLRRVDAEGDNDEKVDNFAINFTAMVDDGTDNKTAVYQQGFKGIYAVEVTFCANFISSINTRTDWYFSEYLNGETIITANDFRLTRNGNVTWVNSSDGVILSLNKYTKDEDKTIRFVFDTDNGKSYIYEVDSKGKYTFAGEGTYEGDSLVSFIHRFRASQDKDSYIKFKNVKLYEIKRSTVSDVATALDTFKENVPEKITDTPDGVTEAIVIPSVPEGYNITATNGVVEMTSGVVIRDLVDKNAELVVTHSQDGVIFKKIYDFVIKARDDVDFIENFEKYDFKSAKDTDEFITVGDAKLTADGYKISKTYGTNAQLIGMLKSEKYENTYIYDHRGVYDYEMTIIPQITSGRAYVELGNYNSETGKFTTFGKFSVLSSGISQTTDTSNSAIVSEKTSGKSYTLKFRVDQGYKRCWAWVNGKAANGSTSYDGNANTINAYRITFDTTVKDGDSITLTAGSISQWVNNKYSPVENALEVAKSIDVDDILVEGTADDAYGAIRLPSKDGYNIVWTADNDIVDFESNKIYRSLSDENITIRATISSNSNPEVKVVKEFKVKVKAATVEDMELILEGVLSKITAESITGQNTSAIIADLALPSKTDDGYKLSWKSLNPDIISDDGVINKNVVITSDTKVALEVTISYGDITVPAKNIEFTIAKRGLNVDFDCGALLEGAEGVVTYSAKISNKNGSVYLKDEKGNKIIGLNINDSGLTLDYKDADGAVIPVNGADFDVEVVMNFADKCALIYVDGVLVADYVPYITPVNNFKTVDATEGFVIVDKVIFDEYSLFAYNIKVFDYYDEFEYPYVSGKVDFERDSLNGVAAEWILSADSPVAEDGAYTPSFEVEFFDVTLKLSTENKNGAVYEDKLTLAALPVEENNVLKNASASSNMRMDIVNNTNKIFDKNFETYMEATLSGKNDYITIDIGSVETIGSLFFFRSAEQNGMLSCDIYLSEDGKEWSLAPVASPVFAEITDNYVEFERQDARYIKITNISANSKKFTLNEVKGYKTFTEDDAPYLDVMALDMPADRILKVSSLTLPSTGALYGSVMTWKSSDTSVISLDGKINAPSAKTEVILTVTANYNGKTYTKSFTYYFPGKGSTAGGGGAGGGGGAISSPSGVHSGGASIVALPTQTDIVQTPSEEKLNTKFGDVKMSDWYYRYLAPLNEKGIINGYDDGDFKPNNFVKREEFLKMLVEAIDVELTDASEGFADVKTDDWFAPYVYTAKEKGIASGISNTTFGVGMPVSRQDMSVMIYNVLGTDAEYRGETTAFVDDNSISEYAYNAVYAMKHMGLINGYENGEFSPLGYLTRAEATKVLYMVLDYLK